jgi:uncharacterized paraquat-inducible protein A
MTKEDLIIKWQQEIAMWRRIVEDPLIYTKETRLKASHFIQSLYAIMSDIEKLDEETSKRMEACSNCGGINTLVDGSLCKDCQVKLSEDKST